MRHILFILISIACLHGRSAAQTLSDCTISSCNINTEMLTGLMGEACAVTLSGNETGLTPGFIEVLLSEAVDVPDAPPGDLPDDPAVEEPTSVDQVGQSLKIAVEGHRLRVYCNQPRELAVYNLSGNLVARKRVEMESVSVLASGVYVVVLWDQASRNVYKINIRE